MSTLPEDQTPAAKLKRSAVPVSAVLPAPVEKGQIVTAPNVVAPVAKPAAVKSDAPAKTKTPTSTKSAVAPIKKAASSKTAATPAKTVTAAAKKANAPSKTKPAQTAPAKSKPAARTAKLIVSEKAVAPEKAAKTKDAKKKNKVVRDSFTMPEGDYDKLAALKARCLTAGVHVKKSELLRAGLQVLETLPAKKLLAIIAGVENVKTGRPAKS